MDKRQLLQGIFTGSLLQMNYSFSQEGEDMILDNLLEFKKKGFYIDIGAYHPLQFSNTMRFYQRGWHGLNIDAMPGSMKLFNRLRPRDINLEAGLSSSEGEMTYYIFKEKALNTFDASGLERLRQAGFVPIKKMTVKTYTIMQVLDKYVDKNQEIDFMDIGVEGFDEKVILQMNFDKYRPNIIMLEKQGMSDNPVLENNGYKLAALTGRTAIYMREELM